MWTELVPAELGDGQGTGAWVCCAGPGTDACNGPEMMTPPTNLFRILSRKRR